MQLNNYDNISHSLLTDNTQTQEQIRQLEKSLDDAKEYSKELQQRIEILYSIIDTRELEIELLEESCIPKEQKSTPFKTHTTLENENEVTGFE